MSSTAHNLVEQLLAHADVQINGSRPWDIQVHNEALYGRVIRGGSLAFGEAYMDGWWDCEQLDELMARILRANLSEKFKVTPANVFNLLTATLFNKGSKNKAFEIGTAHYDAGNDIFGAMLDKRMVYTCGYWSNAKNLNDAQEAKLDLVCRKIGLKPGQTVLDIGCGWGSFAKFAAEKYKAHVTGVTVSKEQLELGRQNCKGLSVELKLEDYRSITGKFDHVISLGMFEHVGVKNYATYMALARRTLKDDGIFLLHTIGGNRSVTHTDPWIEKYIFPNSMLPSVQQIAKAAEGKFVMEDWHNFSADYEKTLLAWYHNFNSGWPQLQKKYGDRFYRMWRYYLLSCAGLFRARQGQLWQIVFSAKGVNGGYRSIR